MAESRTAPVLTLAGLLIGGGLAWALTPATPRLDDSYIVAASARTLLTGADLHYGSPALTGVTSPAFFSLVAALLAVTGSPLVAIRLATALGIVACALSFWALARVHQVTGWRRVAFVGLVLISGLTWAQITNGLETGWTIAVVTGMIAATVGRRPLLVAVGAGLVPVLRPDVVLVGAALFGFALWRQPRSVVVRAVGVACVVALPFILLVRWNTGAWLPETMAAKAAFFAESCWPLDQKLAVGSRGILRWLVFLAPMSAGVLALWRTSLGRLGILSMVASLAVYVWVLPNGLMHNQQRYQYPILLPWAALGCLALVRTRSNELRLLLALGALYTVGMGALRMQALESQAGEYVALSRWLEAHVPDDQSVLVQDAGAPALYTTRRLVDLVGLKSPAVIPVHQAITVPSCGTNRGVAIATVAAQHGTDYLAISSDWDGMYGLVGGLERTGLHLDLVRAKPAELRNGYVVYRLSRRLVE